MKKLKLKKKIQGTRNTVENKLNERKKKRKKKQNKGKVLNFILTSLMVLGIGIASCVLAFGLYIIFTAPDFDSDKLYNKEATVLYDRNGVELTRYGAENRVLISYNDLPQVFVDALVAVEDSRYFQHNGFDAARFLKASFGQAMGNSGAGGASTLTMQLVKNTYTSSEASGIRGIIRKFTDIYMAVFKLEKKYTKEEILEFYVNSQEFGSGGTNFEHINGVEQASQTYFGKSVSDLNLSEASLLVGLFNNPYLYNPYRNPEGCTNRRNVVLSLMERHGYISSEQKEEAMQIPIQSLLKEQKSSTSINPYQPFIQYVIDEVKDRTGLDPYVVPMAIYTTLDTNIQNVVNDVQNGVTYKFKDDKDQVGIAVTSVSDGSILALGAGRNYVAKGINRALLKKQPGSTAKPIFDYGPLIEYNNVSTAHQFFDEPYTYSDGKTKINNWDGKYWGLSDLRRVLIDSRNIPAVQAFQQVEKDKITEFVHNLGIDYGDTLYESIAIGGLEVMSPLEASAAYSAFARGGYYIEPYSYSKIVYLETGKEEEYKYEKKRAMSEETAYLITNILVEGGSSAYNVGGRMRVSNSDIAAKGGTTNITNSIASQYGWPSYATPDHWNVTYSTDYCIALWYGYDKKENGYYLTSNIGTAARKGMMEQIANKIYQPNKRFTRPDGIVEVTVEKETIPLQLASEFTPGEYKMTALYKKGTEPTEISTRFATLDAPTGGKALVKDQQIEISWNAIATPAAIDASSLTTYFNENYGQWAEKYYGQRIGYNNSSIGTIGYQVYLENNGNLQSLGYTNNNYFKWNAPTSGNYTFVVKSAYSIFKNNMSNGLTIKASVTSGGGSTNPDPSEGEKKLEASLNGSASVCVKLNEKFIDLKTPVKVMYDGKDVTSEAKIEANTNIDTSTKKSTTLTYRITYNGKTTSVNRTINVCDSCNNNGTCAS
ncbi:MAG: hypothetical protein HFI09_04885 [Bacilli bacterium]|nr:hypothetical protein [Bacilli bacterium]